MTRKDYNLIALVFADQRPDPSRKVAYAQWLSIVHVMAGELSITSGYDLNGNRRFDRARFLAASGVK